MGVLLERFDHIVGPGVGPRFEAAVDLDFLAGRLRVEAAGAFEGSWHELPENIDARSAALTLAG